MSVKSFDDFMRELPNYREVLPADQVTRLKSLYDNYARWQKSADICWERQMAPNRIVDYSNDYEKNSKKAFECEQMLKSASQYAIDSYYDEFYKNNPENEEEKVSGL